MQNDSDLLEIAIMQNMIRTGITRFEDRPQLVCYFYHPENHTPEYTILCTPFRDGFSIYGLQDHKITLNGNLMALEDSADMISILKHGRLVIRFLVNLRTAYIQVIKTDYYLKEFLG